MPLNPIKAAERIMAITIIFIPLPNNAILFFYYRSAK